MPDKLSIKRTGSAGHDELTRLLQVAFDRALALESEISDNTLRIRGMSGGQYRMFINNLVRIVHKPRYLEIGCYTGSTACAAMDRNVMSILCIDNWAEFEPAPGVPPIREHFLAHVSGVKTELTDFAFIESDFRQVDTSKIGPFNIYLYDGPHAERDQYDGLALYDSCLDNDFIFMVDDWNWPYVRSGTFKAIDDAGFQIDYCIEVRTTQDGTHAELHGGDWHNGYFLSKLSRKQRRFTSHSAGRERPSSVAALPDQTPPALPSSPEADRNAPSPAESEETVREAVHLSDAGSP